jgi:hypothetical protein
MKAEALRQFLPDGQCSGSIGHLSVWLSALLPALNQFVAASEGHADLAFWGSVCNLCGDSTGNVAGPVTGWVGVLFPYLRDDIMNHRLGLWAECFEFAKTHGVEEALNIVHRNQGFPERDAWVRFGIDIGEFPVGISMVPIDFTWLDVNKVEDLEFHGGLFVIHQHPDGALEVRTGWAVGHPRANRW